MLPRTETLDVERHLSKADIRLEGHETAIEFAQRVTFGDFRQPSVILLDLDLLGRSFDFVLQVRKHLGQAPVVVLGARLLSEQSVEFLTHGVPSLRRPVSSKKLAVVAQRLAEESAATRGGSTGQLPSAWKAHLRVVMSRYSTERALSQQQQQILGLYLAGDGDKEIAASVGCSPATVYEHWRRMGKKAGGASKQHVIADFHRFLAGD